MRQGDEVFMGQKNYRLGVMLGGAALLVGMAGLAEAARAEELAQLQSVFGKIPGVKLPKLPKAPKLPDVQATNAGNQVFSSGGPNLSDAQQKAYNKLVLAANDMAVWAFQHEHPDQVQAYGAPADPLKTLNIAQLVVKDIKVCRDAAAAATAAGISGSTPINFVNQGSSLISPTPLANMAETVCGKYQQLAETTVNGLQQAAEADRNRFLNVLSGDRKKVFLDDTDMHKRAVKGPGGRSLRAPQDFVSAPRWYTYGHVSNSFPERWYVHGWIFNGNKLLREINKEGWGRNPPTSAFQ